MDDAIGALERHNRDPDGNPLDGLSIAGRVIRHHRAALNAIRDLTDWVERDGATRTTLIRGIHAALEGDTPEQNP